MNVCVAACCCGVGASRMKRRRDGAASSPTGSKRRRVDQAQPTLMQYFSPPKPLRADGVEVIDLDDTRTRRGVKVEEVRHHAQEASTSIEVGEEESGTSSTDETKGVQVDGLGRAVRKLVFLSPKKERSESMKLMELFNEEGFSTQDIQGQQEPTFSLLADTYVQLEPERSRIRIHRLLVNMFYTVAKRSPPSQRVAALTSATLLSMNCIGPAYDALTLSISTTSLTRALCNVFHTTGPQLRKMYRKHGDLGEVAAALSSSNGLRQHTLIKPAPLTIVEIHTALRDIASCSGPGSQSRKQEHVIRLLQRCNSKSEIKYAVRILLLNLRVGATRQTVLAALGVALWLSRSPQVHVRMLAMPKMKGRGKAGKVSSRLSTTTPRAPSPPAPVAPLSPTPPAIIERGGIEYSPASAKKVSKTRARLKKFTAKKRLVFAPDDAVGGNEQSPSPGGLEGIQEIEVRWENGWDEARVMREVESEGGRVRYHTPLAELNGDLEAMQWWTKRAHSVCSDVESLIRLVLEVNPLTLATLIEACGVSLGAPVTPMLARPATSVAGVCESIPDQHVLAEYKYDGQRAQIHFRAATETSEELMRVFSRNLDRIQKFPELETACVSAAHEGVFSFVLDGEVVAVESHSPDAPLSLLPFQELSTRSRTGYRPRGGRGGRGGGAISRGGRLPEGLLGYRPEVEEETGFVVQHTSEQEEIVVIEDGPPPTSGQVPVCFIAFDLLYLNGQDLLSLSLRQRRKLMLEHFTPKGRFRIAHSEEVDLKEDGSQDSLQRLCSEAITNRCEGLIVKCLDVEAAYQPDKRGSSWQKLKKDYMEGGGDSLDLVPIGAWIGNGRKIKWFSPILMACYDRDTEEYYSVCRCMSGFSDAFYEELTAFYRGDTLPAGDPDLPENTRILRGPKPYYITHERPPIWFEPSEVWEICGADLTLSGKHTAAVGRIAAAPDRGVSLRFPRYVRSRPDKDVDQASTPADIALLFHAQSNRGGASEGAREEIEMDEESEISAELP